MAAVTLGVDETGELGASVGPRSRLILSIRRDPGEGRLPDGDPHGLVVDELRDVAERVGVGIGAVKNKLFERLARVLARIRHILKLGWRTSNVGARKRIDALVVIVGTETDEDAARALVARHSVRGDREAEREGEGLPEDTDALQLGIRVEGHELGLAAMVGLDNGYLSVGDSSFL